MSTHESTVKTAWEHLESAGAAGRLSESAVKNIRRWLTDPRYHEYVGQVVEHIQAEKWAVLDDVFWTVIPFGTGGRRGRMYPIGCNAINDRTIGESAQGLADYVKSQVGDETDLRCAIAYDTRHGSRHFAELCSEVMVAAGFRVFLLNGFRSTPELSFTIRHQRCTCGIMVTASHNPPSDNAVKVYWSNGGQLLPPHDQRVIEHVMQTQAIARAPFAEALASGQVVYCEQEVDAAFIEAIAATGHPGPRNLNILYSPLHGVGQSSVIPVLARAGFQHVEIFGPHATPDGDFPNVPNHVANPENPATFDLPIARAKTSRADVILSTDPDADRLGCAAPIKPSGEWETFTGNQIAALLADYLLDMARVSGKLTPEHYVAKTLVTTEMVRRIADQYGVKTYGDLLVGFKWIAGLMDEVGADKLILAAEESHGYLVGSYVRDKDAAGAALMLAELAAQMKARGQTLHQKLDALFWQYGCHGERTVSKSMPGSEGMVRMQRLMQRCRENPPRKLAGSPVRQIRDYEHQVLITPSGRQPFDCPKGDMIFFDLEAEGSSAAVRPSGTEPKVKFYLFAYEPPEQIADLESSKQLVADRLAALEADLVALADSL